MNFEQIAVILSAITGLSEPENSKPASSIHSNTNRVNGHDMLDQRSKNLALFSNYVYITNMEFIDGQDYMHRTVYQNKFLTSHNICQKTNCCCSQMLLKE